MDLFQNLNLVMRYKELLYCIQIKQIDKHLVKYIQLLDACLLHVLIPAEFPNKKI